MFIPQHEEQTEDPEMSTSMSVTHTTCSTTTNDKNTTMNNNQNQSEAPTLFQFDFELASESERISPSTVPLLTPPTSSSSSSPSDLAALPIISTSNSTSTSAATSYSSLPSFSSVTLPSPMHSQSIPIPRVPSTSSGSTADSPSTTQLTSAISSTTPTQPQTQTHIPSTTQPQPQTQTDNQTQTPTQISSALHETPPPPSATTSTSAPLPRAPRRSIHKKPRSYDLRDDFVQDAPAARDALAKFHMRAETMQALDQAGCVGGVGGVKVGGEDVLGENGKHDVPPRAASAPCTLPHEADTQVKGVLKRGTQRGVGVGGTNNVGGGCRTARSWPVLRGSRVFH